MSEQSVIDRKTFVPYLLEAITNRIGANVARIYWAEYGIGLAEWRVLAALAIEPGTTVMRISEISAIDQGAVSRSIFSLSERGYLIAEIDPLDRRRRTLTITPSGQTLHDRMLQRALLEQEKLLSGLTESERTSLVAALQKLHHRLFRSTDINPSPAQKRSPRNSTPRIQSHEA